jgi:hypothetical protein
MPRFTTSSTFNVISLRPKRTARFGLWQWTHGGPPSRQPENFPTADASRSPHGNVTIPFEGLTRFTPIESWLRPRPEGCSRLPCSLRSGAMEQNQRLQNCINFDDSTTMEPAQRRSVLDRSGIGNPRGHDRKAKKASRPSLADFFPAPNSVAEGPEAVPASQFG